MSDPDATGSRVQAAARAIHRLQHVYGNEGDDPCDMCLEEAEAALSAADAVDATPDPTADSRAAKRAVQMLGRYGWRWADRDEDGVRDVLVYDRMTDEVVDRVWTPFDAERAIDKLDSDA